MANVTGHTNGTDAKHVHAIAGWPGRESLRCDAASRGKDATEGEREMEGKARADGTSTIPLENRRSTR